MKKSIASYLIVSLTICMLLYVSISSDKVIDSSKYSTAGLVLNYTVSQNAETKPSDLVLFTANNSYSPYLGKSFVGFKEALAFKESRGDYFTVNSFGYLGKYQFSKETLKLIGVYDSVRFLKDPELQEKAFIANVERNKWILRRDIRNFTGKKVNGILITESGILAAAHLAGAGSVKNYLRSYGTDNFADAYGTTIEYYMKRFSGYDTSFLKPNKKAKATSV